MDDRIWFTNQAMMDRVIRLFHEWDKAEGPGKDIAEDKLFKAVQTSKRYVALLSFIS